MRLKQAAVTAVEHRGDLLLCTISRQSGTSEDATLVRPQVAETTALGAAYAAGLAAGLWDSEDNIRPRLGRGQAVDPVHGRHQAQSRTPGGESRHPHAGLGGRRGLIRTQATMPCGSMTYF